MRRTLGGLMLAIGIMIAGLSGLCSLAMFADGASGEFGGELVMLVLVFGGIPFVAGVGLVFGGRALLREAKPPPEDPDVFS